MKKRFTYILMFILIMVLAGCDEYSITRVEDEYCSASGRIINAEDGLGLEGVVITTKDGSQSVTTDQDGNWSMTGLKFDTIIIPSKEGYGFMPNSAMIDTNTYGVNFESSTSPLIIKYEINGGDSFNPEVDGLAGEIPIISKVFVPYEEELEVLSFFIDGQIIKESKDIFTYFEFNTSGLSDGDHTLSVIGKTSNREIKQTIPLNVKNIGMSGDLYSASGYGIISLSLWDGVEERYISDGTITINGVSLDYDSASSQYKSFDLNMSPGTDLVIKVTYPNLGEITKKIQVPFQIENLTSYNLNSWLMGEEQSLILEWNNVEEDLGTTIAINIRDEEGHSLDYIYREVDPNVSVIEIFDYQVPEEAKSATIKMEKCFKLEGYLFKSNSCSINTISVNSTKYFYSN